MNGDGYSAKNSSAECHKCIFMQQNNGIEIIAIKLKKKIKISENLFLQFDF